MPRGIVLHIQDQELEQYLLGRLPDREGAAVRSHVAVCNGCGTKLASSLRIAGCARFSEARPFTGIERRGEPRIGVDDSALMRIIAPLIEKDCTRVPVLDVSRSGVKIGTRVYLELGSVLQLRFSASFVLAEVRYCRPTTEGFHAGVHIQNVVLLAPSRRGAGRSDGPVTIPHA